MAEWPFECLFSQTFIKKGACKANKNSLFKINGFNEITSGDEVALVRACFEHGPIAVSIDASKVDLILTH